MSDRPFGDLVSGGRPQVGEQVSTVWRRRLAPDEITRGVPGGALTFDRRNQPTWVRLAPAHVVEPWRSLTSLGLGGERSRVVEADRQKDRTGPDRTAAHGR